jgi:dipeptidyl aminopeptidase/acylaminoacyl peptidase
MRLRRIYSNAHAAAHIVIVTCVLLVMVGGARAESSLPEQLGTESSVAGRSSIIRQWTPAAIVETRRITGIAISESTRQIAFLVKQSFVDSDEIQYALYVVNPGQTVAKKLLQSHFLDELSWHPGEALWTLRGDLGSGVQLYDVDSEGVPHALVSNPQTVLVGGGDNLITVNADDSAHAMGVASYEWSPDGTRLWYSVFRARPAAERLALERRGIRYDDQEMSMRVFGADPTTTLGVELRVLSPKDRTDRSIVSLDTAGEMAGAVFSRYGSSASWEGDSRHIRYTYRATKANGEADLGMWSVDANSGVARRVANDVPHEVYLSVPGENGSDYLTIRGSGAGRHLLKITNDGQIEKDYGHVAYSSIGTGFGLGSWFDPRSGRRLLAVRYEDRNGLVTIPESPAGNALSNVKDNLSDCSFTGDLRNGACVRETVGSPPELVEVSGVDGSVKLRVVVNPSDLQPAPLNVHHAEWTNEYGFSNDGYITYPRSYIAGQKYPVIVVTHGRGARNEFLSDGFQWEIPLQVLAERGYVVLSVNEPRDNDKTRATSDARIGTQVHSTVADMQFGQAFNAVASMEAALRTTISQGIADPTKTGIAGYSRGAEVVEYVMTQSKLFHAAVEGDAGGFTAGAYWAGGWAPTRVMYQQMYGGSPYDAAALENYRKASVSFRTDQFAGPLLQLFSKRAGPVGLELHFLLRDAGIPTDLIFFPHENHVFWGPQRRVAAMQDTLDWFDYWLLGKKDQDPQKANLYSQWDSMRSNWQQRLPK